jgi:hypothetical protein
LSRPTFSVLLQQIFLQRLRRIGAAQFRNNNFRLAFSFREARGEFRMKKLALGLVATATIFTAVPAMAQVGFYAGPGGVGVGVPGPYYNCGYPNYPCDRTYYDYYSGLDVAVGVGPGWRGHRHGGHWHH